MSSGGLSAAAVGEPTGTVVVSAAALAMLAATNRKKINSSSQSFQSDLLSPTTSLFKADQSMLLAC